MIGRRSLRITIGVILVMIGMAGVASVGWQMFVRPHESRELSWSNIALLAGCAVVLYSGVHLMFGAPARRAVLDSWDSASRD